MKALDLFPVSIYQSQVEENESTWLKNKVLDDILEQTNNVEIPENWATNNIKTSWGTTNQVFVDHDNSFDTIFTKCLLSQFDRRFVFTLSGELWFNYYPEGAWQELHDHIPVANVKSHFSCIYYLSYDEEVHTPAQFYDPVAQLRPHSVSLNGVEDFYSPKVKEGTFLMFPTYLQHRVKPQKVSDTPRVTISFNVTVDDA